jgi:hypothetical protein
MHGSGQLDGGVARPPLTPMSLSTSRSPNIRDASSIGK